jgi:hypothetical protein
VSYAREDQAFVERLAAALSGRRLDIWMDTEGLFVGEQFWGRICTEIDRSTAVVCVVSKHSAQSAYCRREAEYAASRNKRMLPVVIQAVAPSRFPEPIRVRHWLSFEDAGLFDQDLMRWSLLSAGTRSGFTSTRGCICAPSIGSREAALPASAFVAGSWTMRWRGWRLAAGKSHLFTPCTLSSSRRAGKRTRMPGSGPSGRHGFRVLAH